MMDLTSNPPQPNPSPSVIMVIQTFYPFIGGGEKQCLQLCKALQSKGVTVKVFTERWKGLAAYEEIEGVPVKRLGRGGPRLIHSLFFMGSILFYLWARRRTYNIIHVHLAASHAVASAVAGKLLNKRVVVKIGGGTEVGEIVLSRRTIAGRLKLWALGKLKPQFVILNEDQRKELHGYGLEKVPVALIPNGVDAELYKPISPLERENLRKKFNWRGLVFLFTGRFSPDKISLKIFETFLCAWSEVFKKYPHINFYLVGQGILRDEYQILIEEKGMKDSVHLWPARDNVSELYQAADIFVLPSQVEGLSNSLLEAMASNLPVLASRVAGIIDIIEENKHGFLFDPASPEELKLCLTKILTRPDLLAEMGSQSRAVGIRYSIEITVNKYLTLYRMKNGGF